VSTKIEIAKLSPKVLGISPTVLGAIEPKQY
jgi:hypothetical protein